MIDICVLTYNPVEAVHCFLVFFFFGRGESVLFPSQNLLHLIINCTDIKQSLNAHKSTESFLDGTS